MRIGIIGSGSIGSLVAGCLASTDSDLLLYGRGLHAAELMVNGLTVSGCLLYTSPSPRDATLSRMPSSA